MPHLAVTRFNPTADAARKQSLSVAVCLFRSIANKPKYEEIFHVW